MAPADRQDGHTVKAGQQSAPGSTEQFASTTEYADSGWLDSSGGTADTQQQPDSELPGDTGQAADAAESGGLARAGRLLRRRARKAGDVAAAADRAGSQPSKGQGLAADEQLGAGERLAGPGSAADAMLAAAAKPSVTGKLAAGEHLVAGQKPATDEKPAAGGKPGEPGRLSRLIGRLRPGGRGKPDGAPAAEGAGQEDAAGSALARLTTLPALLIMAWLIPGLPLLLAGDFVPIPMLLISAPLLVAMVINGLRVMPTAWPQLIPGAARTRGWASWFGLMGTVAVAAGFAAWQLVEHSESAVVLRAQGAYLQTGYWLAQHGQLPIPQSLPAFGGAHPGLGFSSIGFFAHGTSVVPSFTSGLPMLLAGGFWARGIDGAAALAPVLAGLAVLTFGGLTARLVGSQWAPAGALVLGVALPQQYAGRTSLAEPALQVLLFGGLCLLIDALSVRAEPAATGWLPPEGWRRLLYGRVWTEWLTPARSLAGLGGLALGLGVLVSLDSLIYLLPAIPVAGLLLAARRPAAIPFSCGIAIGACFGLADGYLLSRPFLDTISHTMEFIGVTAAWIAALTIAAVQLLMVPGTRRWVQRLVTRRPIRWLPEIGAVLAAGVLIAFAIRPYVQTVRGTPHLFVYHFVAALQRLQGLPVDPARTYAEDSLYWVIWYIGLPTVLLGGFGVALLLRQCLRALLNWKDPSGSWQNWALPLTIFCAGTAAILWQPDIVPDQPWASRRLIVIVLPGLIICAVWAAAWLTGHARDRGAKRATAAVAGLFCVLALVVPTAATTFGVDLAHTGRSGGLRPSAEGMAFKRVGAGGVGAVEHLCGSIRRDSSVVIVDRLVAERFTQVIRGMCDVPTAWVVGQSPGSIASVVRGIVRAGRHPVLLGSRPGQLAAFGPSPATILDLNTLQDPHELTRPPTTPSPIHIRIWMVVPPASAVGA